MPATTWTKVISVYIDVERAGDAPVVVVNEQSIRQERAASIIQGDRRPWRLHFGRRDGEGEWAPLALESDVGISLTGKLKEGLAGATLFYADAFEAGGTEEVPFYEGIVDLSDEAISTAIGSGNSIDVVVQVAVISDTESLRATAQYDVSLRRSAHDGDPPPPIVIPDAGQKWVTASDGKRRLAYYFAGDETWRVMLPVVVDGHPTFTWEDVAE